MPFYTGKYGFLTVGGASFPMEEWSLEVEIEEVEVSNFNSGGVKSLLGGLIGGSFSASGPYAGAIPGLGDLDSISVQAANLGNGAIGSFTFGVGPGKSFTYPVLITNASVSQNVKEKATVEISGSLTNNPPV